MSNAGLCGGEVTLVIKNADGITSDFSLTAPLHSRIRALKTLLRIKYHGEPPEASLKLVHSGRYNPPRLGLSVRALGLSQ